MHHTGMEPYEIGINKEMSMAPTEPNNDINPVAVSDISDSKQRKAQYLNIQFLVFLNFLCNQTKLNRQKQIHPQNKKTEHKENSLSRQRHKILTYINGFTLEYHRLVKKCADPKP